MPTRRYRPARAFFFSSLLLVAATARAQEAPATRLRLAELESELAKKPDLYLVLDPAAGQLEVRARGLALNTVPFTELSLLTFRPLLGGGEEPPALEVPAVWKVTEGPGDADRETIAPTTLRPYSEEEEMAEPVAGAPEKKPGTGEKPSSYRVRLDNGWQLYVVDEAPRLGWLRRFAASVRSGWQRLQGRQPGHPPLITLVVASDDARRLHHLFRTGTPILVRAGV